MYSYPYSLKSYDLTRGSLSTANSNCHRLLVYDPMHARYTLTLTIHVGRAKHAKSNGDYARTM